MSFRATLNAVTFTDRGFKVNVNRKEERVEIIFDSSKCDKSVHGDWLAEVKRKSGLGPLPVAIFCFFFFIYYISHLVKLRSLENTMKNIDFPLVFYSLICNFAEI